MRVPHVIDLNTQEAYRPSQVSLKLLGEINRKIRAENFEWDKKAIATLSNLSLKVIANNFHESPIMKPLLPRDKDYLFELISTDLELELVVPLIEAEYYWKRRYTDHYGPVPLHTHFGWTWKCTYLEEYFRLKLENADPQYHDEDDFKPLIQLCSSYIHILSLTQLQHWKPPKTYLPKERPQILPIIHINFISILPNLPNLTQLEICYGMNEVGIDFDNHMFKVSVEDCEKLGEAILYLKHLKVFRLHRSEIVHEHTKALIKKIMYCNSLVELDLSHCKIGNLGAKCVAMMLGVHEGLLVLNLRNNGIGEEGVLGLAWSLLLPEGAQLEVLDLSLNPVGKTGCGFLMRALVCGSFPRELNISHCSITEMGATFVASMLLINTSLRKLQVAGNKFGESVGKLLLEAMESNNRLLELNIQDTDIPEDIQKQIKVILLRNLKSSNLKSSLNITYIENIAKLHKDPNIMTGIL